VPGVAFETVPRIPGDQHSGDEFTGTEPLAARVSVLPEIDARFASFGRGRKNSISCQARASQNCRIRLAVRDCGATLWLGERHPELAALHAELAVGGPFGALG